MIRVENLCKVYVTKDKQVDALKGVSLEVKQGEIYGVVGYSGAGKSSLIRSINLLEKPTSGRIWVRDREITKLEGAKLRDARKKIGMIFQHFNLLSNKTVFHNIAVPLYLAGISKQAAEKRVSELLHLVDLETKANAYPSQLSGGQKQRVAIARALATNPEVLLCDEATSALDPQTTDAILALLKDINRKIGITILLITHEMNVIREICDRVAVMEDGQIIEQGTVLELFTRPKTQTAKSFIKNIIGDVVPEELLPVSDQGELVRITFVGGRAAQPHLSNLAKKFPVSANILHGHIAKIKDTPFGSLIVELTGTKPDIAESIHYLNSQGMATEVLKVG